MNRRILPIVAVLAFASEARAQTSAFTYQGHLMDAGASANGNYDIQFTLKNALSGGSTIGTPQAVSPVNVVNGIFTVNLDFGLGVFPGSDRWIELAVRPAGSLDPHTVLSPRQKMTSAPYAMRSTNATNASFATSAGALTGTLTAANIPNSLITGAMLESNTITAAQIQNGAIGTAQVADGAVTVAKVATTGASGHLIHAALSGLTTGVATAAVTYPQAFASAPTPVLHDPAWTLGTAAAGGFTATAPFSTKTVDNAADVGTFSSLTLVDGRLAICYYDNSAFDVKFAIARDANPSVATIWDKSVVDSSGVSATGIAMAVVNGRPAVSYQSGGATRFAIAPTVDGSGTWTIHSVENVSGAFISLAVVNGRPAVAYQDGTQLKYAIAPAADGSGAWLVNTVSGSHAVASMSLAVVNGRPAIAYCYQNLLFSTNHVVFTIAGNVSGIGTSWLDVTVETIPSTVGTSVSLAVVNGRPAISYSDSANTSLKYAIAPSADGQGAWAKVTVDDTADVGYQSSLEVVNGQPAISYYDYTNGNLKYASATAADGTGAWNTTAVDGATADVGAHTSMVMAGGRPGISYYDITNTALKFALLPDSFWTAGDATATMPVLAGAIQAGAVGTAQIAAAAVTSGQLASNAVTADKLEASLAADLARLSSAQTFTGANTFANAASSFAGDGAALTSLNASNLATGTVADGLLGANVPRTNIANTFSANQFINGRLGIETAVVSLAPLVVGADVGLNIAVFGGSHPICMSRSWPVLHFNSYYAGGGINKIFTGGGATQNYAGQISVEPAAGHMRFYTTSGSTTDHTNITSTIRMTIAQGGNVGIGRHPSANKLEVEGEASKTTAGDWLANSDRRIKEDIQPIRNALDMLDKVRLVDFRYTEDYRAAHPGIADQRYLNVVAQEFAEVFPNHVKSSGEKLPDGSEILQVDTWPLTIYSAAAVQELNAELKAKDTEMREMKQRLERLEKLLEQQAGSKTSNQNTSTP